MENNEDEEVDKRRDAVGQGKERRRRGRKAIRGRVCKEEGEYEEYRRRKKVGKRGKKRD